MPLDFPSLVRPILEMHLAPGEPLEGIAAATQRKGLGSQVVAIGVTDLRLVIQALDSQTRAKGEVLILTHESLESIDLTGAPDGWRRLPRALVNGNARTLVVRLHDGHHLTLILMQGGTGSAGPASSGPSQEHGVRALATWVQAQDAER